MKTINHASKLEKGKPSERVGRKATGLIPDDFGYGGRVAERMTAFFQAVGRTAGNLEKLSWSAAAV